ncbi:MAG TPA: hypothetical protein VME63_14725 [Dyella sp.]|uniref:hypothetical protein n=1 Tax=Dyella sp. TaxID=1869338 RepID=UPI002D09E176|nr:hypothetical protein [Dyella sp.]HTV86652.1 hypothetical protein [Dyella sp.]
MKKHNGHSQGSAQSKTRNGLPGGLQAALAKNIARALTQQPGGHAPVLRGGGFKTSSSIARGTVGKQSAGPLAALDDTYIKVLGGTAAQASNYGPLYGMAIGNNAQATGAIAIGSNAFATRSSSTGSSYADYTGLAIGSGATSYAQGVALGQGATASGLYASVALGTGCIATGNYSVAVGDAAQVPGNQSMAIGYAAGASASQAIAMGPNASASSDGEIALGLNAGHGTGANASAISLGTRASANSPDAVAIGTSAVTQGPNGVAIGNGAGASLDSVAVGHDAQAPNQGGTAIGAGADADMNATAIGQGASAFEGSTAIGASATTNFSSNAVALGANSSTTRNNTVAVGAVGGERQIVNLAAGTQGTDAVDVNQLSPVVTALGGGASINPTTGAVNPPSYALANGGTQSTIGGALGALDGSLTTVNEQVKALQDAADESLRYFKANGLDNGTDDADASGNNAVAIGSSADASASGAIALGQSAVANTSGEISIGVNAGNKTATSPNAVAIGTSASAGFAGAVAIGNQSAAALESVAVGDGAKATNQNDTAIGAGATATVNATAIGQGASAIQGSTAIGLGATTIVSSNAVALGAHSSTTRNNTVAVGAVGSERQIVNVAAGTQGTDAVDVNQLKPMITALGGGASIDPNTGAVTGPTYTIDGAEQTTVEDALTALNEAIGEQEPYLDVNSTGPDALATGKDAVALGSNANASGDDAIAIGRGSLADIDNTVSLGNITLKRKLVNVAPGDIASASTDAINGSQLYDTNQQLDTLQNGLIDSGVFDPATGVSLAVTYSNDAKTSIVLGSLGNPVEIINVAPAIQPTDAVNLTQLTDAVDQLRSEFSTGTPYVKVNSTGPVANAVGVDAVAIGSSALASVDGVVALGLNSRAAAAQSVAIGNNSLADAPLTVSIGGPGLQRRLVNLQAGIAPFDAVNVSQLQPLVMGLGASIDPATGTVTGPTYNLVNGGTQTTVDGGLSALDSALINVNATVTHIDNTVNSLTTQLQELQDAAGENLHYFKANGPGNGSDDADAAGLNAVAIGSDASANAARAIAMGASASASSGAVNAISIGTGATTAAPGAVAIGANTGASENAIALGDGAQAININDMAIGAGAFASSNSTALGAGAQADGNSTAVGPGALAFGGNTAAIGAGATTNAATNAVALGANSSTTRNNTVAVGAASSTRQIVNLAAGTQNTDALNVSQLVPVVNALGGGASINAATGVVTGPTYTLVHGGEQTTLEGALSALDQAVSESGGEGNPYLVVNSSDAYPLAHGINSIALGALALAPGNYSVAVGYHSVANADDVFSVGRHTHLRRIIFVSPGNIAETSTDAINGGQLYDTNLQLSTLQDTLTDGGVIDPATGLSLAVTYSNSTKNIIVLGNPGAPVEVTNVATGLVDSDAVNVAQLNTAISNLTDQLSGAIKYVKVNSTGSQANATGVDSVAIGSAASATAQTSVAIGTGARASGINSVAIGVNSTTTQASTVSVGGIGSERKIINVDDGDISDGSTDAINGGQLFNALGALNTRMGVFDVTAPLFAIEGVQGDNTASLNGGDASSFTSMVFGVGSFASGVQTAAFGLTNVAASDYSAAIGVFAQTGAGQPYSAAIGTYASTTGTNAVAIGSQVQANADNAVAIGTNNALAIGTGTVALGNGARVNARTDNSIAIGTAATIATNVTDAIALGHSASVSTGAVGGIALGQGSVANRNNALSLGSAGGAPITRQIVNVSAGTQATDVVNVSQLAPVVTALGGGAAIGSDGSIQAPAYEIDGTPYSDVGSALTALADMTGSDPNAVSYDDTAKDTVTLDGTNGTLLTNLQDDSVAADSKDAINGSQLFDTALSVATSLGGGATVNPDGTVSEPVYTVGGAPVTGVGDAIAQLDDQVTGLQDTLDNSGLFDPSGDLLAVIYTDDTKTAVTLGTAGTPVAMTNLAPGAVSDTSTDAVNGSQLNATNQAVSDLTDALKDGGVLDPTTGESLAVTYADDTKTNIALGSTGTPVTMSNVAPGDLSDTSTDAVNGAQLNATNQALNNLQDALDSSGLLDPATGELLAVVYTDDTKTAVTLGTATGTPVAMTHLAAGEVSATSVDAVNGSQLFGTAQSVATTLGGGATVNPDGTVTDPVYTIGGAPVTGVGDAITQLGDQLTNLQDTLDDSGLLDPTTGELLAVVYTDDTKTAVTLGTTGTPVAMTNLAAGEVSSTSVDAVNGSQLYGTAQSVATALGGGSAVNPDGSVSDPVYTVGGAPVTGVGDAITQLGDQLTGLQDTLDNSGLLDPTTGELLAVVYTDDAKTAVTLGAAGTPVTVSNMAPGVADTDGVNVAQLNDGLSTLYDELTTGAIDLKYIKVASTGAAANANGANAVAIGSSASATIAGAVAIGTGARVSGVNSIAIGYNSVATDANVVSVGAIGSERKIENVDNGDVTPTSTDAINGSQLYAVRKVLDTFVKQQGGIGAMGAADPLAAMEGRANHNIASLNGGDPAQMTAAAIGALSMASGANAIAMGLLNVAASDYSVALGHRAHTGADQSYSVAMGSDVQTNGVRAVALGTRVQANAEQALALGSNDTFAIGKSSIAMGDGVKARSDNSIAVGRHAMVVADEALALGADASVVAEAAGGVALGCGAVADRGNAISIGGGSIGDRQIIHVSKGTEPTDAVNVEQLREAMAAMRAEIQLLRSQLGAR